MSVRVKVCLNKIFSDYRKEAFVLVDQNWKFVYDFESHIQNLFNIQFGIYLTIGGSLLPSYERVNVIQSGDAIVINKRNEEKSNSLEVSSNPIQNKISTDNSSELEQSIERDNQSNDDGINPFKRGKRIRKRKKKQTTGEDIKVHEASNTETKIEIKTKPSKTNKKSKQLITEVSSVASNGVSASRSTSSHIRFSDDDDASDIPESNTVNNVLPASARVMRPVTVLSDANKGFSGSAGDRQVSEKLVSAPECKRGIASLKEFANDNSFVEIASSIDFEEIVKGLEMNSEFVPLKGEMKAYDLVAFKMLKIGKNYEPQLSEWIIGMVKDVEDVSVAVHILAGKDETSCPDGKLSMAMSINDEETESSDLITLKREDLLNVKVFHNP